MTIERHTHLLSWLEQGYVHCKHGSQEWCESYLKNAHAVIMEQDRRILEMESVLDWIANGDERSLGVIVTAAREVL